MIAWVYHGRTYRDVAARLVTELRAEHRYESVIPASARHYQGEIHRGDVVFHDGTRRDLVWQNEAEGVECRQFAGSEMDSEVAVVSDPEIGALAYQAKEAEHGAYTKEVRQNGAWFSAYLNGEKIGKAQRSETDAWALFEGRDA